MIQLNPRTTAIGILNILLIMASLSMAQAVDYSNYPVYERNDLGVTCTQAAARIRIWAPTATNVRWKLYTHDLEGEPVREIELRKAEFGTWQGTIPGNWEGLYYSVQARIDDQWLLEVPDPYARALGRNGRRGQLFNPEKTNPAGWNQDQRTAPESFTDIVLYEGHVRDLTVSNSSGITHKGKFLGLAEKGTV